MRLPAAVLLSIFVLFSFSRLNADTVYLKNGRGIEGIIKNEDAGFVELEVAGGVVKFSRSEIDKIQKTSPEEAKVIKEKWERKKIESDNKIMIQNKGEADKNSSEVEYYGAIENIKLNAVLNNKVQVILLLDTGASAIMLRKDIGKKLGLDLDKLKPDVLITMADGHGTPGKRLFLESVRVEGVKEENVEACILLNKDANIGGADGLLGMSFLKKFDFKIDHKNRKLILKRI